MGLESRIQKLESAQPPSEGVCRCPDAICLVGTPYKKICFKCGEVIDLFTWGSWRTFHPESEETNFFAFCLRRDDENRLAGKPNGFFIADLAHGYATAAKLKHT
jgi:hypothetical protein